MKLPLHGSNPHQLYQSLSISIPESLIDFSVNINPLGTLPTIKENWLAWYELISDYPDPTGERLKTLIAENESVPEDSVLLGNGGAELITLLAQFLMGKRVGIIQPTFIEYEKMCTAFGCEIEHIVLQEEKWNDLTEVFDRVKNVDALFLCHPNNPTGITYPQKLIDELIEYCEKEKCYLIIDEAFYDFANKFPTATPYVPTYKYVIVIRSLTKMYSIAGLRLGYMIASPKIINRLYRFKPAWSVNAIALEAGIHCIEDRSFVAKTRSYITKERERMTLLLRNLGYKVSDSQVNYLLARDDKLDTQYSLLRYLVKKGIVPRHTENFRGLHGRWLRLAIKSKSDNDQLYSILRQWSER